jgi:prepilin peptidase CpaA
MAVTAPAALLLTYAPVLAMLAVAGVTDWRHRRIPNALVVTMALSGLLASAAHGSPTTILNSILGLLLGFALMLPPFLLGALRGGDVKLLAALGAWLGPVGVLVVFVLEKLVGLAIALAQAARAGRLTQLFRNSAVLAVNVAHLRDLGGDHVREQGERFRSIDRPLPWAVPVGAAVALLLAFCAQTGWRF